MKISFAFILSLALLTACGNGQRKDEHSAINHTQEDAVKYTCPMHPQVMQNAPGTCPLCGMDLVKVAKSQTSGSDLMLNDSQIKLANITLQKVSIKPVGESVVVNGTLTTNEENSEVVSTRAAGRIEKLFIKETGHMIEKGQPLYVLYSESLLTLEQEYLLAKEQFESLGKTEKRYESFLKAAERKLLLYGLTQKQIAQLTKGSSLQPRITFLSPVSGVVTEINASEGQYLQEGGLLYRVEDITSLWVEAELYPGETSLVKPGDKMTVRVSGSETDPIETKITFLSPEYRANSQITVMRGQIKNPELLFKAGQQAQVSFTHSSHNAIAIPSDAVIRDGNGAHVYVQSGHNTFQPRMVKTGLESFNEVEITEGLNEGDTIAVTGAYLLYSEIILKKGNDPMAGHQH